MFDIEMSLKLSVKRVTPILIVVTFLTFLLVLIKYQIQFQKTGWSHESFKKYFKSHRGQFTKAYPKPWTVVDLRTQYLINNLVCPTNSSGETSDVILIILTTSHPGNVQLREKLRQFVPQQELYKLRMRRLFLLGKVADQNTDSSSKYKTVSFQQIQEESEKFKDILVGDFMESYRNLTYKHLMGLEWVGRYCPQAQLVLKQDDDVVIDFHQISQLVANNDPLFSNLLSKDDKNGDYILGKVLSHQEVIRDPKSKWFVQTNEYPQKYFPPFVSGWGYITTPKVAQALVNAAGKLKFFWIDDMHITGTLREAVREMKIKLVDMDPYFTTYKGQIQCCVATPKKLIPISNRVPYWCDFIVGAVNDDWELMKIFYEHSQFCDTTKTCGRRVGSQRLNRTCVVTPNMIVNKFITKNSKPGKGIQFKSLQNKGSWKIVRA